MMVRYEGPPRADAQQSCGAIAFGELIQCSFAGINEEHRYTFDGEDGDRILVRASDGGNAALHFTVKILEPGGRETCSANNANSPAEITGCSLENSGEHVLSVMATEDFGGTFHDYALVVQRLNDPGSCTEMEYADVKSRTLPVPGDLGSLCFAASAGDGILVRMDETSGGIRTALRVFDERGVLVCEGVEQFGFPGPGYIEVPCDLTRSGKHLVLASSVNAIYAGSYDVSLELTGTGGVGGGQSVTVTPASTTTAPTATSRTSARPTATTVSGDGDLGAAGEGSSGGGSSHTLLVFILAGALSASSGGWYLRRRWRP